MLPSKDLGSKTAVYISTVWRDDFMPLSPVYYKKNFKIEQEFYLEGC